MLIKHSADVSTVVTVKTLSVHLERERMIKRRPSGKIEVRCRTCGKIEKVSPVLLVKDEDGYRYKCNKCSCSPG